MISCCPFEQCCPFYSLTTSVTISDCLIHLFAFKSSSQMMLSSVPGRTDISFSYFLHFSCLLFFFIFFFPSLCLSVFGLKVLKSPYSKYSTCLPGTFPWQGHSLSLKHSPESPDGHSIQVLASRSDYIHVKHSVMLNL